MPPVLAIESLREQTDSLRHQAYDFLRANIMPLVAWPKFNSVVEHWIDGRESSPLNSNYSDVLPALTHLALGGDVETVLPLVATWMLYILGARVLDDVQDQDAPDRPWLRGGIDFALPIGTALLSVTNLCLSHLATDVVTLREILEVFGRTGAIAAKNQSMPTNTYASADSLEKYFTHIIATTAELFAVGAWAGGRLCTRNENTLYALREFGLGLGMKTAIILDCRDLRPTSSGKPSDLTVGSYKLPVLYAVSTLTDHPDYGPLMTLLGAGDLTGEQLEAAVTILEEMGALNWSIQVALEYENRSRLALASLPERARRMLVDYVG